MDRLKTIVMAGLMSLILAMIPGYGGLVAEKVESLKYGKLPVRYDVQDLNRDTIAEDQCVSGLAVNEVGQPRSVKIISDKGRRELLEFYKNALKDAQTTIEESPKACSITAIRQQNTFRITINDDRVDGKSCRVVIVSVIPKKVANS